MSLNQVAGHHPSGQTPTAVPPTICRAGVDRSAVPTAVSAATHPSGTVAISGN